MQPDEFWRGSEGDAYHQRNRVRWQERIPFWKEILDTTQARSCYEWGCGPGWNLSAIRRAYPDIAVYGTDINMSAIQRAQQTAVGFCIYHEQIPTGPFELVFSVGALIHVAPDKVLKQMQMLADISCDYVLAVEYESGQERMIPYRDHDDQLWARDYGKLYQELGLKLVLRADAGKGFDQCTAWLLRKP